MVQDAIKADSDLVTVRKKCKEIVTYFHHSAKAMDKIREIQKQVGAPENKLIQEVESRWNSTYYMFEKILQQHQAVHGQEYYVSNSSRDRHSESCCNYFATL